MKMAKHNCAICGAEVGLMNGQKLADGNFICKKVCGKKTFKLMNKVEATLGDITAHIEQIEKGTKIFNEVILPLKKTKNKDEKIKVLGVGGYLVWVSPSTGLLALVEPNYKFFIFGKYYRACVYRLADLVRYDFEDKIVSGSDGKMDKKEYCVMSFKETNGLHTFPLEVSGRKDYNETAKYFDTLFGIQKTLGNAFNNAKRQMNAFKTAFSTVKAAADGTLDEAQAAAAAETLDASVYGDRTQWIAKADAVLASYK
jgi:hypothetical protein